MYSKKNQNNSENELNRNFKGLWHTSKEINIKITINIIVCDITDDNAT